MTTDQIISTEWTATLVDPSSPAVKRAMRPFNFHALDWGEPKVPKQNLIHKIIGETVQQAPLFAYMFRRFGQPNRDCDRRNLAAYCLATPLPNMFCEVSPHHSGVSAMSFDFYTAMEDLAGLEEYDLRDIREHEQRMADWMAADERRPSWADEWVSQSAEKNPDITDFRSSIPRLLKESSQLFGSQLPDEWRDWSRQMQIDFNELDPKPTIRQRNVDWRSWPDEDPMKPYAEAAETTLRDLLRPVDMYDCELTMHGLKNIWPGDAIPPAKTAGYGMPVLDDSDMDLVSRFYGLLEDLGDGDPKQRLRTAIAKLEAK